MINNNDLTEVMMKGEIVGTKKMNIKGQVRNMDVYRIPIDKLYYNDKNDRIATWISKYESENGIIAKYSANNTINSSRYRPHGSMVVEAVASNYKANGLGNLWRGGSNTYRITTTALFRSSTLTSVGPVEYSDSDLAFLPIFINTIIGSGIVISMVAALYTGRRRLCLAIAAAVTTVCISMSCVIESGGGGGGTYDKGPNTNYYTSIDNFHSKTGNSGITIYDIQCDEYGNGSFRIKKD